MLKMASTPPKRKLIKGPLRLPQRKLAAPSYTQAPVSKNEISIDTPGTKRVEFREVSLTSLPQPFVNPVDAFGYSKPHTS